MLSREVKALRKRIVGFWDMPPGSVTPALAVLAAAFAAGALAGLLRAAQVGGEGQESLSAYLQVYLEAARTGNATPPEPAAALWEAARWPLLTLLLSFTALGAVGIPAIFAVRGFLLSFAVASFVRIFGGAGAILAFFAFGFTGTISLPVLFLLGVQGLLSALARAGQAMGGGKGPTAPPGRAFWLRSGLCAAGLVLSALLECWAVPALLASVAELF